MSLNWKINEKSSNTIVNYKTKFKGGEEYEQIHPVLNRLIFLTMTLKSDLDGDEKQKADVKKRLAYINLTNPDLTTLTFGEEADKVEVWDGEKWVGFVEYFKPKKRFDQDGSISGWQVVINDEWVDKYWGLSTNADRLTFSKWFTNFNDSTLKIMERNGY